MPAPPKNSRQGVRRWIPIVALLVIASLCLSRSLDRSLWLDEAWVANSVVADAWQDTFFYPDWVQTSPALFLALVKMSATIGGETEASLRFVPAALAAGAIALYWFLALDVLPSPYAFVGALMLLTSPSIPELAQSVKHYTADVFAAVVLLCWAFAALRGRPRATLLAGLVAYAPLSFLSHSAIFFAPSLLYVILFGPGKQASLSSRVRSAVLALSVVGGAALVNWMLFLRFNRTPSLTAFWSDGFLLKRLTLNLSSVDVLAGPLVNQLSLWPLATASRAFGFGGGAWPMRIVAASLAAVCIAGFVELGRGEGKQGGPHHAAVMALPLLSAFTASLLSLYPWAHRLLTFAAPIVLLCFLLGVKRMFDSLPAVLRMFSDRWGRAVMPFRNACGATSLVLGMATVLLADEGRSLRVSEQEQAAAAVSYLLAEARPRQTIYLDASMTEQFKFYSRGLDISESRVVFGNIGAPCCRRNPGKAFTAVTETEEVARLLSGADLTQPVLSIFTTRRDHLDYLHLTRAIHELISEELAKQGCSEEARVSFEGVVVLKHLCQPRS